MHRKCECLFSLCFVWLCQSLTVTCGVTSHCRRSYRTVNFAWTTHEIAYRIGCGTLPVTRADEQQPNHNLTRHTVAQSGASQEFSIHWCFPSKSAAKNGSDYWFICWTDDLYCTIDQFARRLFTTTKTAFHKALHAIWLWQSRKYGKYAYTLKCS